jgi:hypothetical protein
MDNELIVGVVSFGNRDRNYYAKIRLADDFRGNGEVGDCDNDVI